MGAYILAALGNESFETEAEEMRAMVGASLLAEGLIELYILRKVWTTPAKGS